MDNNIIFTPEKFKRLKKEYNKAMKENKESFKFENSEILTAYAKYLIEYLTNQFNKK